MDYSTEFKGTRFTEIPTVVINWDPEFVIENLPPWVYKNHPMPRSISECNAKISALEHTLTDMDLQIEVKQCEKKIAALNCERFDEIGFHEKLRKIIKAKQSTLYVISALKYWYNLNKESDKLQPKFDALLNLLIEEPVNFVDQVKDLLN